MTFGMLFRKHFDSKSDTKTDQRPTSELSGTTWSQFGRGTGPSLLSASRTSLFVSSEQKPVLREGLGASITLIYPP